MKGALHLRMINLILQRSLNATQEQISCALQSTVEEKYRLLNLPYGGILLLWQEQGTVVITGFEELLNIGNLMLI